MQTVHKILISDARHLTDIVDESVDLVVTSPPYPMIQMWDELFCTLSDNARKALTVNDGNDAFEAMHRELDRVWAELFRVLKEGSFACINIGDAVRSVGDRFQLYPNHSRIISCFRTLGFDTLPVILWRKTTNAPNKFMGSGMLPSGAYVTLEHEYILVFRKGSKRVFKSDAGKLKRMRSAFFWEERNKWFSDVWDFNGISQVLKTSDLRGRSAAFPLELAYRLINMYSLYEDVVLDPFMGTGTTQLAAIACGRNSIGIEIDGGFASLIAGQAKGFAPVANDILMNRINGHHEFIASCEKEERPLKYLNRCHGFPVVTRQETELQLWEIGIIEQRNPSEITAAYSLLGTLEKRITCKKKKSAVLARSPAESTLQTTLPL